jgi:hypothetical protein
VSRPNAPLQKELQMKRTKISKKDVKEQKKNVSFFYSVSPCSAFPEMKIKEL